MPEIYKCDHCKLIFIELFKFLDHQSQCNVRGIATTSTTPLINDNNTAVSPSVSSFAASILNCHDPTAMAIPHQQNQHEMQQLLLLHGNGLQKLQSQQPTQFDSTFQSSHCKTIIDISTAQNVLKQEVTTIKTEFQDQKAVDPSIIDYHIITKLPEVKKVNINKKPKKSRKKKEKIPLDPNAPKKIRVKSKAIRKKACELSRSFQCKICGRSFRRNKLKEHMLVHLVWPDSLEGNIGKGNFDALAGNYVCNYCPERVESFVKLRSHILALHKDVKVYMCPMSECRQLFGFQDVIIEHSKGCAFKSTIQCPICYQYFNLSRELEIHILEHKKEIDNEIQIQKQTQKSPSEPIRIALEMITNLDIKRNIVSEKVVANGEDGIGTKPSNDGDGDSGALHPLQCPVCFVKYTSKVMLLNHMHTDTHEHECEVCQKVFLHRRQLRMHSHTHRNLRCICPICNRSFKMQKMLKSHMLTHTDQKFFCDICGSVSTLKSNLVKHFKTHITKLEKCGLNDCRRMFRSMKSLKAHRISHRQLILASGRKIKIQKSKKRRRQSTDSSDDDDNNDDGDNKDNKIKRINTRQTVNAKKNVVIPGIVVEGGKITKGIDIVQEYTLFGLNNIITGKVVKADEDTIKNNNTPTTSTSTSTSSPNDEIKIKSELIKDEFADDGDVVGDDHNDNDGHDDAWVDNDFMTEIKVELIESVNETVTIFDDKIINNQKKDVNSDYSDKNKTTEIETKRNNTGKDVWEKGSKVPVSVPETQQHIKNQNQPNTGSTTNADDTDNLSILELVALMNEQNKKNIIPKSKPKKKYYIATKIPTPKMVRDNLFTRRVEKGTKYGPGKAECNVCGRHFIANAATMHIESHRVWRLSKKKHIGNATFDSNDELHRCPYCPTSFPLYLTLRTHMIQNHSSEKVFKCPLSKCQQLFDVDHEFIAHCRECVFNSADHVRCPICHTYFIDDQELKTHKIIAHQIIKKDVEHNNGGRKPDAVGDDNQTISTLSGNQLHGSKVETINNSTETPNKVKCKICHEPYKNKIMLAKHMHRDSHDHQCIYCGKQFLSLRKLSRHHDKHRKQPAVCYICGKLYDSKNNLNTHVRRHATRFTCDICNKMFNQKSYVLYHLKMHTLPVFRCPHEGCKVFRRTAALMEKHIFSHTQMKHPRRSRNKNSAPSVTTDPTNRFITPFQIGSQFDLNSYL